MFQFLHAVAFKLKSPREWNRIRTTRLQLTSCTSIKQYCTTSLKLANRQIGRPTQNGLQAMVIPTRCWVWYRCARPTHDFPILSVARTGKQAIRWLAIGWISGESWATSPEKSMCGQAAWAAQAGLWPMENIGSNHPPWCVSRDTSILVTASGLYPSGVFSRVLPISVPSPFSPADLSLPRRRQSWWPTSGGSKVWHLLVFL
jgi:hypothetical protein